MAALDGKIALVTGASRGLGKGIALALGKAGAIVYLTGRTRQGEAAFCQLPGSIDETAATIAAAGGTAIAMACDHGQDEQIEGVFERIASERGQLDLLVNNVWAGYQSMQRKLTEALQGNKSTGKKVAGMEAAFGDFTSKFWQLDPQDWDRMHQVGVRANYIAAVLAARMMSAAAKGLIVNMTADVSEQGGQVAYSMAKASINRMTADMAAQLSEFGVAVVGLQPGMVLTEMFAERFRQGFLDAVDYPRFEAPASVGQCVVALAQDAQVAAHSGAVLKSKEVAAKYGLAVLDGSHVIL